MEREFTREDMARAVRRMQDYILENAQEPITARDLAKAAGYSPWHAQRIFKELTGQPPFEYIRKLRLSQAALVLRDRPVKVVDVALDFMFGSHEGFTRSFSKEFGISPVAYRKKPRPRGKGETDMEGKDTRTIFVQAIERPARKILLKRGKNASEYFEYCEEAGCEVWGVLTSVKEALYEPLGLWLPSALRPACTSEYVQGVELPLGWKGDIPEGFELDEFGPALYLVFQGEPYPDEDFEAAVGSAMEKIDRFDPSIYGFAWAPEAAPRFQLEPQGWRGYIEARPVKRIGGSRLS